MTAPPEPVYRRRDFAQFVGARFLSSIAMQVQSVAVGWQIYDLTRDPLALGLVGLCQFVPMFLLALPAGDISDRFDQRRVFCASVIAQAVASATFLVLTLTQVHATWPFYAVLVFFGASRGFAGPASQSLLPFLVPRESLQRALAWGSSSFQGAVLVGPALGGFLFVLGPSFAYAACCASFLAAGVAVVFVGGRRRAANAQGLATAVERVTEGVHFVRTRPVILGALSLDLFAVLLGGATALLPIFARDILHAGPLGLGFLRSAPALGAALVGVTFGRRPLERHAGPAMFAAVFMFGIATIVFGLSTNFWLSLAALAILGAADMVSVFIRQSLVQMATPDAMRGRVSAVNMLFIGASNELGEFESGFTAAWFGTVPAVVIGGLGTLVVVATWMGVFPPLRRVDRLASISP
ncbi:MAG TPA: MFS transporter [Rhizomicrobium sp.]